MNLKIQKFAEGGASSSAFFYQPLAMATTGVEADTDMAKLVKALTAANKKSSSDTDKGKLTDKDFLGLLKDIDGLPSDIVKLYNQAQTFYVTPSDLGEANYTNFTQLLTKMSLQAKIAKFNKEVWNKSRDTMFANHSENEMAITDTGGIVIEKANGGIDVVSVDQWKKNPYAYKTLTNADIMDLRAQKLPGDNSILNIVNGSTSVEAITDKIQKIIKNAATSSVQSYISTDNVNTKAGITVLKGLLQRGLDPTTLTMHGVYQYTTKENADQVTKLLDYAWGTLSTKEKTLLTARAGQNRTGVDTLLKLVAMGNISTDTSVNYQDQLNSDGSKKATPSSKSSAKEDNDDFSNSVSANQAYMIQTGRGGTPEAYTFQPENGGAQMTLYGRFFGALDDPDGKTIAESSISDMLAKTGLQNLTNTKSVYFGNKKVSDLRNIAYLNNGGMRVILPAIKDGLGNVSPNYAVLEEYQQAQKRINNLDVKDPMYMKKQSQILSEYPSLRDLLVNGKPNPNKWAAFLVVDGKTNESSIGDDVGYATVVSSKDQDYDDLANILYPDGKGGHFKDLEGVHFYGNENLYKAPVFIPITSQNTGDTLILSSKFKIQDTLKIGDMAATKSAPMQNSSANLLNN